MQEIFNRYLAGTVKRRLQNNPTVAILGLRQCGKATLTGQISYLDLTPFLLSELEAAQKDDLRRLWLRGGFPRSYLAEDLYISFQWRLERAGGYFSG